jgi:serine/threonine protein phosphatase PrpC
VGVGTALRVRYYAVTLKDDSVILLSSDGLHGVVHEDEIEEILRGAAGTGAEVTAAKAPGTKATGPEATLEEKCEALVSAAHAAGSPDNVTVLLIRRAG